MNEVLVQYSQIKMGKAPVLNIPEAMGAKTVIFDMSKVIGKQNDKFTKVLTERFNIFSSETSAGIFLNRIKEKPKFEDEIFENMKVPSITRERFMDSLEEKGFADVTEENGKKHVKYINWGFIVDTLIDKIFNKQLWQVIEENQGMNNEQIAVLYGKDENETKKDLNSMCNAGLLIVNRNLRRNGSFYFTKKIVVEGDEKETKNNMIKAVNDKEAEFSKKPVKDNAVKIKSNIKKKDLKEMSQTAEIRNEYVMSLLEIFPELNQKDIAEAVVWKGFGNATSTARTVVRLVRDGYAHTRREGDCQYSKKEIIVERRDIRK